MRREIHMFGHYRYPNRSISATGVPAPHSQARNEWSVVSDQWSVLAGRHWTLFGAGGLSVLACFALAVLGSLLLLAGGANAAAPPPGTASGAASAGPVGPQQAPKHGTGPAAANRGG